MIVVELKGGLGNQMFEYASAYGIARSTNQKMLVYKGWFEKNKNALTPREYELDCFNINARFIDEKKLLMVGQRKTVHTLFASTLTKYCEPEFTFDKKVFEQTNVYLDGFWQSPKYFEKYRNDILEEFTFNDPLSGENVFYADSIDTETNSVSLHVRRGDYVSVKEYNANHGTSSLEYYKAAMDLMKKRLKNPHFYIISDEPEWCIKNLKIDSPHTFIRGNTAGKYDMQLMAKCKHNIIANSSFSWWGAWLNRNPNKIVIAPKKWFNDTTIDTGDLIPKEWVRL